MTPMFLLSLSQTAVWYGSGMWLFAFHLGAVRSLTPATPGNCFPTFSGVLRRRRPGVSTCPSQRSSSCTTKLAVAYRSQRRWSSTRTASRNDLWGPPADCQLPSPCTSRPMIAPGPGDGGGRRETLAPADRRDRDNVLLGHRRPDGFSHNWHPMAYRQLRLSPMVLSTPPLCSGERRGAAGSARLESVAFHSTRALSHAKRRCTYGKRGSPHRRCRAAGWLTRTSRPEN
jgi:hypothetical protein